MLNHRQANTDSRQFSVNKHDQQIPFHHFDITDYIMYT